MKLKALSVKEPWISKIRDGPKNIETRTWATDYKGLLILLGSKQPEGTYSGKICCKADLVDCRPMKESDAESACVPYESVLYSWILDKKVPLKPVEHKGQLGLFHIEGEIKEENSEFIFIAENKEELKMEINKLPIEKMKLKDLKPAPYNPRTITKKRKEELKRSYEEFGYAGIVVWNKQTGHIISGHQGVEVMKELIGEETEIDVKVVDLSLAKEKALNIRLNKHDGEFNENMLVKVLGEIETEQEEALKLTGFNDKELEILLDKIPEPFEATKEDKITIEDIKNPIVQEGDLFEINNKHRILCGDSTKIESFKQLFENDKIDLLVTSPPYNANIRYSDKSFESLYSEYLILLENVFKNSKEFMNNNRFACVNMGDMTKINLSAHVSVILEKLKYHYQRIIYWIKPEGAARAVIRVPFPRWYKPKVNTESIIIYSNNMDMEENPAELNVMIVYSDKEMGSKDKPTTKDKIPIDDRLMKKYASNIWKMTPETRAGNHPAPFPIILPENCIKFYSLENEIIFDPFLGAGTTILAAEKNGRRGYGIDLDPSYVQLSLARMKQKFPQCKIECKNRELVI